MVPLMLCSRKDKCRPRAAAELCSSDQPLRDAWKAAGCAGHMKQRIWTTPGTRSKTARLAGHPSIRWSEAPAGSY